MKTFLHSGVLGTFLFVSYLCMVLGEQISARQIAGIVLVFLGVWITVRPGKKREVDTKCRLNSEANSGYPCSYSA